MMKRWLVIISLLSGLLLGTPATFAVYDPLNGACTTNAQTASSPVCKQYKKQPGDIGSNPVTGSGGVLQTITNIMAMLTGVVAVIMIVVSGFSFITAGGNIAGQRSGDNPSKAKKARAQLSAAVIGLIIVALSWSILTFIIQKFVQS